jgi:hypothetical protein
METENDSIRAGQEHLGAGARTWIRALGAAADHAGDDPDQLRALAVAVRSIRDGFDDLSEVELLRVALAI